MREFLRDGVRRFRGDFRSGLRGLGVLWRRRKRLDRRRRQERNRNRRAGALCRGVTKRFENRREGLAGAAGQRGHRHRHDKAVAIRRACGRLAGGDAGPVGDGRTDQIGQTLQNIDPHHPVATDPETGGAVKSPLDRRVGGEGSAAGSGQMRHILQTPDRIEAAAMQRPEQRGERARGRLQQQRQIDMIGAEADAEFAKRAAFLLREALDFFRNAGAVENAQILGDLEGDAARRSLQAFALFELQQRPEQLADMLGEPEIDPLLDLVERRAGQLLVGQNPRRGAEHAGAGGDFRDRLAKPADGAVIGEGESVVDGVEDARGPGLIFAGQSLERRRIERFRRLSGCAGIGREAKTLKASDMLPLNENVPGGVDFGF